MEELRSQAMAHLGAAPEPPPKRQRTMTLVPVMVNIDRDEGDIREVRAGAWWVAGNEVQQRAAEAVAIQRTYLAPVCGHTARSFYMLHVIGKGG